MPIYMDGKVYEDQAHLEAAFSPMLKDMGVDVQPLPPKTGDNVDPNMVVTPNQMDTNQQLQQQDGAVLGGTEVSNRIYVGRMPIQAGTEPAGEFNPSSGTLVADSANTTQRPSGAILEGIDWSRLNQPLGELKGTAPEDTPVLFKTKAGNITEGDIALGIDIAMSAGPGTIVGAGKAFGPEFFRKAFNAANMERAGASEDDILKATGMFKKGPNGRWVTELSDENMTLVDRDWRFGETGKLSDFVNHPKLYEAYPELKNVNFKVADADFPWIGGYSPSSNTITINTRAIKSGDEGILDVLAHEIQHWVQRKEGFQAGGNPDMALKDAVYALGRKIQETRDPSEKRDLMKLMYDIANNDKKFAEYMYQRMPGEVEANVTMARRKLSDRQRQLFPIEEFKKFMEGSENTMSGGKYYPEFNYPKPEPLDSNLPHK